MVKSNNPVLCAGGEGRATLLSVAKPRRTPLTQAQRDDAARLKVLFNKLWRGSQEEFGLEYEVGSQGNVSHYLNATMALNLEVALKFARGLRVEVEQFSPTLATLLPERRSPVLTTREARHLHVLALLSPQDQEAILRAAEERLLQSFPRENDGNPGFKRRFAR